MPQFELSFPTPPDLDLTMDIQIPALAWQQTGTGQYSRVLYLPGSDPVTVTVEETSAGLRFTHDATSRAIATAVTRQLQAAFPQQVADLDVGGNPILDAMAAHYAGVIVMYAPAWESLVLTILSQVRTGEIVRAVYPQLAAATGGATAAQLAATDPALLAELIYSAGPYKAERLSATARIADDLTPAGFERKVIGVGVTEALEFLTGLPGVAHKTAACVLVFAARTTDTLPVDVHLFRVADRLGLARHAGKLTPAVRNRIIADLLELGPALAPAHFTFLLVGRDTCKATLPLCGACFLATHCPSARRATGPQQLTLEPA